MVFFSSMLSLFSASSTAVLSLLIRGAIAQLPSHPIIYNNSAAPFTYIGCYTETLSLIGGQRALKDMDAIGPRIMTVQACLNFCNGGSGERFRYAGLQYSRECWCGHTLDSMSKKVSDADCDLPCDGDKGMICGGSNRLSLYVNGSGPVPVVTAVPTTSSKSPVATDASRNSLPGGTVGGGYPPLYSWDQASAGDHAMSVGGPMWAFLSAIAVSLLYV